MKKKWMLAVMAVSLLVPTARLWAEDAKKEKMETMEERKHEEQEAMTKYNKAAAKHGHDSKEANKAWKHVLAEYKEHGDAPPARPESNTAPSTKKS